MSRRPAAWLCVLLAHALGIFLLLQLDRGPTWPRREEAFSSEPITLYLSPSEAEIPQARVKAQAAEVRRRRIPAPVASRDVSRTSAPARVDWSLEGEKSAVRLLERQAEAQREAQSFAGPRGTWPSLTKRPPPAAGDFRWREGIDEPEYNSAGLRVFHPNDRCEVVTSLTPPSLAFGCSLEKPKAHGDLFDDMQERFDEGRLPETGEGNGTEPEALRPAN